MAPSHACPLCEGDGGQLIVRRPAWRVVRVVGPEAAAFPGFYRVIWNTHVAEFTDLADAEQSQCLRAVAAVERVVREHLRPDKVNLASLGNVVPHLHWHVVARYIHDSHFPAPVWAAAQRPADAQALAALQARLPACDAAIAHLLR
jgi:diadenosine tetraphosphate (Ap4A) HIT family hydrolase